MRFETLQYRWDPDNPLTGKHPTIRDLTTDDGRRATEEE
jgi:molybdopterin-synthase adenylyltransferase